MTPPLLQDVVWDIFPRCYDPSTYEGLRQRARDAVLGFMRDAYGNFNLAATDDLTTASHCPELDRWCHSLQGQQTLVALVQDIHGIVDGLEDYALPAHDQRQILFKDAAEALRFATMEKPEGYKSLFVIPAFAHDVGRLVEGIYHDAANNHDNWIPHAHFSFLMFRALLDRPAYADIPPLIKNHMLYAVAAHSGVNGNTYMAQAVQACDRVQLIGPEGFFRGVVYVAGLMGGGIAYPKDKGFVQDIPDMHDHNSALSILEYFSRNMYPTMGTQHQKWMGEMQTQNLALLMLSASSSPDLYGDIFAPELGVNLNFGARKRNISPQLFGEAVRLSGQYAILPEQEDISAHDVMTRLTGLIDNLPGAAPLPDSSYINIIKCLSDMDKDARRGFAVAVKAAMMMQHEQDKIDADLCRTCLQSGHPIHRAIAAKALDFVPVALDLGVRPDSRALPPLARMP